MKHIEIKPYVESPEFERENLVNIGDTIEEAISLCISGGSVVETDTEIVAKDSEGKTLIFVDKAAISRLQREEENSERDVDSKIKPQHIHEGDWLARYPLRGEQENRGN